MAIGHSSLEYWSAIFLCNIQDSMASQVSSPSPPFQNNGLSDCFSVTSPAVCTLAVYGVPLVACVERHFACVLLISKNTMTECHKCRKLVYFGEFSYLTTPFIAGFPKIIRFVSKHEHRAQSTVAHWSSWTSFKLRSVKITVAELYPKIKFFLIFLWRFAAEQRNSLGKVWHPGCLRCEECGKRLNPGQHSEVRRDGDSVI